MITIEFQVILNTQSRSYYCGEKIQTFGICTNSNLLLNCVSKEKLVKIGKIGSSVSLKLKDLLFDIMEKAWPLKLEQKVVLSFYFIPIYNNNFYVLCFAHNFDYIL